MIKKRLFLLFSFLLLGMLHIYGTSTSKNIVAGLFLVEKGTENNLLYYNVSLVVAVLLIISLVCLLRIRTKKILEQRQILETQVATRTTIIEQQKEELAHFIKLRDTVYALIAHDLKDTIYSFRNLSQKVTFLLNRGEYTRLSEVSTHIENSSFQLVAVVDNLLAWGMLEQGLVRHTAQAQAIGVLNVTRKVEEDLRDLISKKRLTIEATIAEELTINLLDQYTFYVLIRNVLHNAIKYSKQSGHILLDVNPKCGGIEYSIKDFGVGIDSKTLDLLKQDFVVKQSKLGTKAEKGSGIGLALCYKLVQHIGGTISIESEKGKYTKVVLYFPTGKRN